MNSIGRPVAIVTGGRRGIGLGIARALAQSGFDLALTGIGPEEEAQGALDLLVGMGAAAEYVRSDLADLDSHAVAVDKINGRFGRIDCLVNNAGMGAVQRGDFLDLLPDHFDTVLATNLRGTVFFTQAVAKSMLAHPSGRARAIITIGSVSATMSSPERLDYCMSKAALASFSKGLALRLAETGISVFEVRPGIIRSDMTAGVSDKYDQQIGSGLVPMKRWGEPDDVGTIVAALAGGAFGFATGSVIEADGGLSIARL